ncbi:protein FAR1-RELATED SEQUENCE 5-like [Chenopodium quinoa]|uniref:protein FAR1-RELATED SEQUENCE 5-like n=1 Tax=Chenopodium quinoa TaxID=63459 RepID=UPI000B788E41|nr:protein FAR1-RELATED SEQUENCE 5-like [Chenopodium quinoa]
MELVVLDEDIVNADTPVETIYTEAKESELMRKTITSDDEAYNLYNDYAFKIGFSIRKGNNDSKRHVRKFEKLDFRTNCGAFVEFIIDPGVWTVVDHQMEHNHPFIPVDKRHLLRSQRNVSKEQLKVISVMKASGVRVTDSLGLLSKEVGGSPNLGCTRKDIYNALTTEKANRLDGSDCNQLIKYFAQRQAKEADFYYEFEVDEGNSLTCVFWRDGRMKRDYEHFGDLMVFDTTYRTNKYGMRPLLLV